MMRKFLTAITLVMGMFMLMVGVSGAQAPNDHQITICHATGNDGHYSMPHVPKHQIYDDKGHGNQQGVHPGDIIPPFSAGSHGGQEWGDFPGQNWDAEGQEIWNNGCEVTEPPTTEPPENEPCDKTDPDAECYEKPTPPTTEPPVTTPPVTEPPAAETPVTTPPVTEPPVTEPPVTEPPEIGTPDKVDRPTTATSAPPPAAVGDAVPESDLTYDELAYTGDNDTVWLIILGVVLLLAGLYLVRRGRM